MNIVVIGVGYVGLVSGLCLAKLKHNIQFLDIDESKINSLKKHQPPFFEPELSDYLNNKEILSNVNFSSEYKNISWDDVDIVMVCVQTPSLENNQIDTSFVSKVFMSVENYINDNTLVCIKSTIHPQALEKIIADLSFDESRIVFNPEFLREGSAFTDFFQPDRIVIGSNNKENAKKVGTLYKDIDTEILFTDPISSQLIKYLSNAYLPLRLSFVNEASQIISVMGGNLQETLKGIGMDTRIGQNYFRPSPGWGGSCFPKDVDEINSMIKSNNLSLPLISNIKESNLNHQKWFAEYLINLKNEKIFENIFLIGLAFKDNTDDLRHSPTISIYKILKSKNQSVHIFDLDNFEYNESEIKQTFLERSLIVEMYPIGSSLKAKVEEEVNVINEFTYIKFWE
jgi:UDPglucose 6-dehydrogenase